MSAPEDGDPEVQRALSQLDRSAASLKRNEAERAMRNQAIYNAVQKGADVAEIAARSGLTEAEVEKIAAAGPFGVNRPPL